MKKTKGIGETKDLSEVMPQPVAQTLAIARFEILAFFRDRQRDRLVFHPDVAKLMTEAALPEIKQVSERQHALRECIKRLPERQRKVLKLFYVANALMKEIARQTGHSVDGVKSLLLRINLIGGVLESLNSGVRFRGKGVDTQPSENSGHLDIRQGILKVSGDWINGGFPISYTEAIDMGLLTAYGGTGRVDMVYDDVTDKTTVTGIHPLEPNPMDGSAVVSSLNEISWILPEPNDPNVPGAVVTCDVYFGSDPEVENNPKIVTGQAVQSVPVNLAPLTTYYWALDIYDSSFSDTEPIHLSPIFTFNTKNQAPVVNAGEDITTWLTDGTVDAQLTGTVSDVDGMPEPYTVLWNVQSEPNEGAAVFTPAGADQEAVTVTLTALGQYVLTLAANDGELTGVDTITINVFSDSCEAAKSLPDYEPFPGDLNGDFIVNDLDLAILQEDWLKCNALDCNDLGL